MKYIKYLKLFESFLEPVVAASVKESNIEKENK